MTMKLYADLDLDNDLEYRAACERWARGLPDWMVRSFMEDYRNGLRDEATLDAQREYMRRRDAGVLGKGERRGELGPERHRRVSLPGADKPGVKKMTKRCERHQTYVGAKCHACRELNGLPPVKVRASRNP